MGGKQSKKVVTVTPQARFNHAIQSRNILAACVLAEKLDPPYEELVFAIDKMYIFERSYRTQLAHTLKNLLEKHKLRLSFSPEAWGKLLACSCRGGFNDEFLIEWLMEPGLEMKYIISGTEAIMHADSTIPFFRDRRLKQLINEFIRCYAPSDTPSLSKMWLLIKKHEYGSMLYQKFSSEVDALEVENAKARETEIAKKVKKWKKDSNTLYKLLKYPLNWEEIECYLVHMPEFTLDKRTAKRFMETIHNLVNPELVRLIVTKATNPERLEREDRKAHKHIIERLVELKRPSVIPLLIQRGFILDTRYNHHLLLIACKEKWADVATAIIERGIDLKIAKESDHCGLTAIDYAKYNKMDEIVTKLTTDFPSTPLPTNDQHFHSLLT